MTETLFTPGEWTVSVRSVPWKGNPELGTREIVYVLNRFTGTHVFGDEGALHPTEEHIRNGALLGASKDLYEALEHLLDQVERTPGPEIGGIHKARAALAKARGESSHV